MIAAPSAAVITCSCQADLDHSGWYTQLSDGNQTSSLVVAWSARGR